MGSFIASRTIVAHRLLYCRYDRPATRQYADAAAVEDIVLDDRDCPSATDALQSNQHACEKSRPVNKTNYIVDDIISCSGSQHKLVGRSNAVSTMQPRVAMRGVTQPPQSVLSED